MLKIIILCISFIIPTSLVFAHEAEHNKTNKQYHTVEQLKVTTLSTMLASRGIGEWGYAALIEVDNKKILFDTGNRPDTVLQNAKDLKIDLSEVEDVI